MSAEPQPTEPDPPIDLGVPGASARRIHERRRDSRRARREAESPFLGRLRARRQPAPQHEDAWARGALGEEIVGAALARGRGPHVVVLHDRAIPGRRENIDHLVVAPSGVWVIDAKNLTGDVRIRRSRGADPQLWIGRRRGDELVTKVLRSRERVRRAVGEVEAGVAVNGMLCVVSASLPRRGDRTLLGVGIATPREASRLVRQRGSGTDEQVDRVARALAKRFPRA